MQEIINKITAGELNNNQLIEELMQYESASVDEYNAVIEHAEQSELNCDVAMKKLEASVKLLKSSIIERDATIETIKKNALIAVDYAKTLESKNILLNGYKKECADLTNQLKQKTKKIKSLTESNKKLLKAKEVGIKDGREYRKQIAIQKSDIARLRLTGHKQIGNYAFTLFPSKILTAFEDGTEERQVNLVVFTKAGAMKIIGVDKDGEINQPRSHNFKFDAEQEEFIKGFAMVAKQEKHQFTDRLLSMVN